MWKLEQFLDPLGRRLVQERPSLKCTRSVTSKDICLVVCTFRKAVFQEKIAKKHTITGNSYNLVQF